MDVWRATPKNKRPKVLQQFRRARFGSGKLSSSEFILFGFTDGEISDEHIARFAGKQAQQAFNKIYNDRTWYAVTKHKLLFETVMKGAELPVPETIAVYDRKGRGAGPPVLKTDKALEEFLTNAENYPLFCKPMTGLLSIGTFLVSGQSENGLQINHQHTEHAVMNEHTQ